MVYASISTNITFNLSTIFILTSLPHLQQGLVKAISSTLTNFSIAVFIAFADFTHSFHEVIADTRRLDKYFYDLLQPKSIITLERVPATLPRAEKYELK
jgi:hypothetical protein